MKITVRDKFGQYRVIEGDTRREAEEYARRHGYDVLIGDQSEIDRAFRDQEQDRNREPEPEPNCCLLTEYPHVNVERLAEDPLYDYGSGAGPDWGI